MNRENVIFRFKLHHVLFWVLLFSLWYYFRVDDYRRYPDYKFLAARVTALKVIDLAFMVYLTNYLLIPRLLYKKQYLLFGITFIVLVFGSSFLKMNLEGKMMNSPQMFALFGPNFKTRFYDNVVPHFLLVSTGAAFKLLLDYAGAQRRLGEMAKEKAEAELNFLKSQINPHFLFNSLNSVYFLIDKTNEEARKALHRFSEMLRYQLYECRDDKIAIEKEIGFLQDYVDLQKLRKDENYSVEFNSSENVKGFSIEPLLLMSFVENAFKHISHSSSKRNFIKLDLSRNNGEFRFSVLNSKETQSYNTGGHSGIGLKNVQRRLELLYPGKHELQIEQTDELFKVDLKIKI
jgi:two-component system, LytTR family, sensor kinase